MLPVADLLASQGLESWKGPLSTLLMPPVPFIVLALVGARLLFRSRFVGWSLLLLASLGQWAVCTPVASDALARLLLDPPRALSRSEIAELRRAPRTAVVVLGAGRRVLAPEYGVADLRPLTAERLRFGVWLARETALPLAFSGGLGHGASPGPTEAEVAARVAERDFGRPLRWTEGASRDTRENAGRTVPMLAAEGIERIVLVTHALHMPRARAAFEQAARRETRGPRMRIVAAPLAVPGGTGGPPALVDFLPQAEAFAQTRYVLHEWLGRLMGA